MPEGSYLYVLTATKDAYPGYAPVRTTTPASYAILLIDRLARRTLATQAPCTRRAAGTS